MDYSKIHSWTREQVREWFLFHVSPETADILLAKGIEGKHLGLLSYNKIEKSVSELAAETMVNDLKWHGVYRIPDAPMEVAVPQESNRIKFVRLLREALGGDGLIDQKIIDKIEVHFTEKLTVSKPHTAKEVYEMVSNLPGTATKTILRKQGISINGLWNVHTSKIILSAVDKEGCPLLVKTLGVGNDESAISKLGLSKLRVDADRDIPLVPSTIVCAKSVGSSRREYKCVIMPHYSTTISFIPQQSDFALHKGGLRMINAVQYIHDINLVHMDIKPHNIMIDPSGNWFLGDFGSCVAKEEQITSCTSTFLYENYGNIATFELDWFMLLATLVQLANKAESISKNNSADLNRIYICLIEASGDFGQLLKDLAHRCKLPDIFATLGRKHTF